MSGSNGTGNREETFIKSLDPLTRSIIKFFRWLPAAPAVGGSLFVVLVTVFLDYQLNDAIDEVYLDLIRLPAIMILPTAFFKLVGIIRFNSEGRTNECDSTGDGSSPC